MNQIHRESKKLENNIRFYESISGTPDLAGFHEQMFAPFTKITKIKV